MSCGCRMYGVGRNVFVFNVAAPPRMHTLPREFGVPSSIVDYRNHGAVACRDSGRDGSERAHLSFAGVVCMVLANTLLCFT